MDAAHVAVVGAGAIGSFLGGKLSQCANVTLICRDAHAQAIERDGLRITGVQEAVVSLPAGPDPSAVRGAELVLVTTKAFDLAHALEAIRPHLEPHAAVMLVQNGLGNEDIARAALPHASILRAVTYLGVTFAGPGHVVWTADGTTTLGSPFGEGGERLETVVSLFGRAGLQATGADDIQRQVWQKTLANVGINALGAVTGMTNGELVEDPHTLAAMGRLVEEAQAAARTLGYDFAALDRVVQVARDTGANRNSMLQDIEAGRRTEVDFLNAAVVRIAHAAGLAAAYNACLTRLVKAMETLRRAAPVA